MKKLGGKKKKNSGGVLFALILLFALLGLFYGFLGSGYGVVASCDNSSIIGFARVPPPLMSVVQPEYCKAIYEVSLNQEIICSGEYKLLNTVDVIPCSKLKEYNGQVLVVNVTFFNSDTNTQQGSDFKELEFQKKK